MSVKTFRHRGLKRLAENDDPRRLPSAMVGKLRRVLTVLDHAARPQDMDGMPGWRLHRLSGDLRGFWSVTITGNWRIIFRMQDGDAFDVDLIDYH